MPDADGCVSRADLASLIGIAEIRVLLSYGRRRLVARSYAERVSGWPGFPLPLIVYPHPTTGRRPHTRLWLLGDVEAWMDRDRPGWRHLPPAPTD